MKLIKTLIICLISSMVMLAKAHPHSAIDMQLEFVTQPLDSYKFNDKARIYGASLHSLKSWHQAPQASIYGLVFTWQLDKISSSAIAQELKSKNPAIVANAEDDVINNIRDMGYFSNLYQESKLVTTKANSNLPHAIKLSNSVVLEVMSILNNGQLEIKFLVALTQPLALKDTIRFNSYDTTYFVDMRFANAQAIKLNSSSCKLQLLEPQVDNTILSYATSKEIESKVDDSLGIEFAQEIRINCK